MPALLAGNSVILKPSPQTPTSAEQIQQIFKEAGLPDGVLQIFHCGSVTQIESIARSLKIQLVCFTGSVANGLAIQQAANDRVPLRIGLELGGKDPAYVRSDVDVKWAAEELVDGAVFNSGQSCCSVERIYVDEKIHDEFVSALQEVLKGYRLGDPFDKNTHVGPVVSKRSAETIREHVKDALEKGAKDATPENATFQNPPADGNYVAPTLLTNVNHEMVVMTEETFGPVIPVMKVKNDTEAIKLMNDSQFGLTASIWTKDVNKGHELADDVEAGTVFVNRCDYPAPVSSSIATVIELHTDNFRTWHGLAGKTLAEVRLSAGSASTNSLSSRATMSKTTRNRCSIQGTLQACCLSRVLAAEITFSIAIGMLQCNRPRRKITKHHSQLWTSVRMISSELTATTLLALSFQEHRYKCSDQNLVAMCSCVQSREHAS